MTTEEKARAYDKAREKIILRFGYNVAEEVFLEFEMSEDEKIRNRIIGYLKQDIEEHPERKERIEDMLVWLEKQGEPRVNMIQWKGDNLKEVVEFTGKSPKFGEWFKTWEEYENYVHSHGNIFKLFCEDGSHYEVPIGAWIVKTPDGYNIASKAKYKQSIEQKPAEKAYVLMSLDEAIEHCKKKSCGNNPCALEHKQLENWLTELKELKGKNPAWSKEDEDASSNILYILNQLKESTPYKEDKTACKCIDWLKSLKDRVQPQQKQEWSEEDEKMMRYVTGSIDVNISDSNFKNIRVWFESIKDRIQPKQEWSEEDDLMKQKCHQMLALLRPNSSELIKDTVDNCHNWLKSLKDRVQPYPKQEWSEEDKEHLKSVLYRTEVYSGYNMFGKVKEDFEWLKDLPNRIQLQPQQEWSEEDKKELNLAVYFLENAQKAAPDEFSGYKGLNQKDYQIVIDWLKSLKDRVQLQIKQEWSEEDESMRTRCIGILGKCCMGELPTKVEEELKWLKSLRPQNTWKPSEEQMHYLSWIANIKLGDSAVEQEVSKHLNELYEDLKKLI